MNRHVGRAMTVLILLSVASTRANEHWLSFHNGGNTSITAQRVPLHWAPDDGIAWQLELPGYGQSAPVIWGDRVFVTAVDGDDKGTNIVLAIDARSGQSLWTRRFPATVQVRNSYMVSRAAPTPLLDSSGLFVMFESGDIHALTFDGEPRWHRALFDNADHSFQNSHGYGSSPTQTDDAVIALVDHRGPSYLAAFDKRSGETLWKTERNSRSSWTSPQVTRWADQQQIIVSSAGTVDGYDAETGDLRWSHAGVSGNVIPSVTVAGDRVFVGASIDRDHPDAERAATSNCCLQITPHAAAGYRIVWRAERAVCDYASPLLHSEHVYYVNKVGVLYCLEAATGRECYAQRISSPCWAQPIGVGDRVYLFGKDGRTTVVRSGSAFERLAVNSLWADAAALRPRRSYEYEPESDSDPRPRQPRQEYLDPIVYGVAAVDGAFFVRVGTHLYRVGGSPPIAAIDTK